MRCITLDSNSPVMGDDVMRVIVYNLPGVSCVKSTFLLMIFSVRCPSNGLIVTEYRDSPGTAPQLTVIEVDVID